MKRALLITGATLAIAGAGLAAAPFVAADAGNGNGPMGYAYHGSQAMGDSVQLRTQDQTQLQDRTATQGQLRLHLQDGSGDRHANCDGTPGDMHRYQGSD